MTGGAEAARAIATPWGCDCRGDTIFLTVSDFAALFDTLSRMIYLTPLTRRLLALGLPLYRLMGRAGLAWAKIKAPVRF